MSYRRFDPLAVAEMSRSLGFYIFTLLNEVVNSINKGDDMSLYVFYCKEFKKMLFDDYKRLQHAKEACKEYCGDIVEKCIKTKFSGTKYTYVFEDWNYFDDLYWFDDWYWDMLFKDYEDAKHDFEHAKQYYIHEVLGDYYY